MGRELGISYKIQNKSFFLNQGISTDHAYNEQAAGFDGIAVALLGNLSPVGVIFAAAFFAVLQAGKGYMNTVCLRMKWITTTAARARKNP